MSSEKPIILVVDDDVAGMYVKSRMLQRAGYEVEQAGTGAEALRLIRGKRAQLILLDIQLPDMNGLEICETIKADPEFKFIPVLQTSATFTNAADTAAGLNRGADAYLAEPLKEDVLIATVNALLRARRAEEELRKQREWLQVTLRSIGDGVVATDISGHVLFMNPVAEQLSGWSDDEARGRDVADVLNLVSEITHQKYTLPVTDVLRDHGKRSIPGAMLLISRTGAENPVEDSVAPIKDSAGNVSGLVLVFREIGERKRSEQRMAQLFASEQDARHQAESANRAKDEFLAVVSHELRTPLTSMLGWSKLLKSGTLSREKSAHALEVIERNVKSQAQIIEDLLDISRIIAGKLVLNKDSIELQDIIQNSIESIRTAATSAGINIRTFMSPVKFFGDDNRLQQVFWNLLTNAIKFTPAGGNIDITLSTLDSRIFIVFKDNGVGIDPAFLPRIFDRFSQDDSSPSRKTGGLGIGLSIVQNLVRLHGGEVNAASAGSGKGSSFTVTFPVLGSSANKLKVEPVPVAPSDETRLDGRNVLIVEDEPDTREMLSMLLTTAGATITAVGTAEEGMKRAQLSRPDVIISDIGLPGEDGFSFIRRLREFEKTMGGSIPALALTAYARPESRWHALEAGFQMYAAKPVESAKLIKMVSKLGGLSRSDAASETKQDALH